MSRWANLKRKSHINEILKEGVVISIGYENFSPSLLLLPKKRVSPDTIEEIVNQFHIREKLISRLERLCSSHEEYIKHLENHTNGKDNKELLSKKVEIYRYK